MTPPRPTLLILDDEPGILHALHDQFRMEYRVLTTTRGAEALGLLAENEVHAILADQRMPEMSGVEFLRQAKELRSDATRLLMTGYADIKAVVDAINQGNIYRYITKPWDPDELPAILRGAVEHRNLLVEKNRLVVELTEANARLVAANRLKGAFIEVASHELNTPVAVILGMAGLWKMTLGPGASAAERDWVDRIHGAGRRLATTVERMLKLLRTDRLDHTLDARPIELGPLVHRSLAGLEPFLRTRRQEVEIRVDPGSGTAEIDPDKIGDVLTNLLSNAIKFTPDGGRIVVEVGLDDEPDWVRFRVIDPGIGIDANARQHLFEPFFTGFDTMHHSSGEFQFNKRGIGLGLSLVKTFVGLHGGTVEVSSTPSHGSVFSVHLPRKQR